RPLDARRNVAPRILENRGKIVGRMARKRVLEIEEPEMSHALAFSDEHDIFSVIVAQDGDRAQSILGDGLENLLPRGLISVDVRVHSYRRAIPVRKELELLQPLAESMDLQARHGRMPVEVDKNVRGQFIRSE